jgi:(2R)-sulfolactate sulfo-lyase subunit alpha
MAHAILMHKSGDDVGVAVRDLKKGESVGAVTLEGRFVVRVKLSDDVPLGHKVAMRDLGKDKKVIEYGRTIGGATRTVRRGAHVHTHNLKTLRWER